MKVIVLDKIRAKRKKIKKKIEQLQRELIKLDKQAA